MKKLFAPAIVLMNRLKIVYKFSLISVLFLLPIVGLGYLLVSQLNASIDDLDRAISGTEAVAEETLSASRELSDLTASLHEQVERFRV